MLFAYCLLKTWAFYRGEQEKVGGGGGGGGENKHLEVFNSILVPGRDARYGGQGDEGVVLVVV
jgi:hypothetical protein